MDQHLLGHSASSPSDPGLCGAPLVGGGWEGGVGGRVGGVGVELVAVRGRVLGAVVLA